MNVPVLVLVISFVVLLVLNVPVAFCMGIATLLAFVVMGAPAFGAVAHNIATGIDSFSLLAIPFFILSGLLMGHGGIARRLIDFANVLVGRFRGGLAFVNILTCMLFGAISGSATAAISSVGGFLIPLMNKMGYHRDFNASVTITAATTGLLIPPSNVMIVYSLATGGAVSIAAIFMAGYLPGILVGFALMVVSAIISIRNNYGQGKGDAAGFTETVRFYGLVLVSMLVVDFALLCFLPLLSAALGALAWAIVEIARGLGGGVGEGHPFPAGATVIKAVLWGLVGSLTLAAEIKIVWRFPAIKEATVAYLRAVPAMLLVLIVIGGILLGWFTPTEASAVAVLYSFILALVYRELKIRDLPQILLQCGVTTAVVFLLIATSVAMSWVMASENVPQDISAYLVRLTDSKVVLLLLINAILLVVGMFMDMTPAVLIFTPIFLPIVEALGLNALHFGIVMIMNLCIGLCTPPVGTCLFLGCGIAETTVTRVMRHILPFYGAMVVTLLICTFIPEISLWIPARLGFVR
ncbi:MAG: TRAP transporter large permease [Sedimentisphaerales bacterium]|nr:TRAP transporter large permease [Sedimentisphaerales bacterium]HNY80013.1 TRAP transporter large permease [Sedimentisphaerales bacterium]HOC64113.1 TRAP transporter large permease [Sedimentisphaerales bacterium]HOH65833.1 TRAP transporter large permease [Sedimentisphaerales bacterium]HQA91409.1 TRAP transporter large permease [Sedimentisphaerales bacterium]